MIKTSERAKKHIEHGIKMLKLTGLDADFARAWGERLYWMGSADVTKELLEKLSSNPAFGAKP